MDSKYNKVTFGVSKDVITPAQTATMIGFGTVFGEPFTEVHDDLFVRTLMLRDADGETVLLIAMDLLFHDDTLPEALRDYAGEKYGVKRENLHVSYTHTHFGPAVKGYDFNYYTESYEAFLFDRICKTIDRVFLTNHTGYLKYAKVDGEWNMSRRLPVDGVMEFKPNPLGEVDKSLYMLKLEDEQGKMRALAMNFACHPSNMFGCYTRLSSEYPGRLCMRVEGEFYGTTALFFQGFGADCKLRIGVRTDRFSACSPEDIDEVALTMTQRIKQKMMSNDWQCLPVKLVSRTMKLDLPLEVNPKEFYEERREFYIERNMEMMKRNAEMVINNYETWLETLPLNCGIISINPNFYIYSLGGEPGINIQTVLRESMPDATVLCFGYNDAIAYVPSDKMIEEGGYEAEGSVPEYRLKGRIAPGVDKIYCDALKNFAAEVNK